MCGICGIWQADEQVEEALIRDMCARLIHRGPDDEGYYIHANLGLGMRRLSIIDVEGGRQPICNEDGSILVVFNGELYNYIELRAVLLERGHTFQTNSDTETLVHAYEEFGLDCLRYFNGMFAFALWDSRRGRLWIARDRLGKKPLYYRWDGHSLIFASELKGLLPALKSLPAVNLTALHHYLSFQYVPSPHSIFEGIQKLEAAHYLLLEGGQLTKHSYWDLPFQPQWEDSPAVLAERLREEVSRAVRWRLRSDVPLGVFLSGGMDSAIITAQMAKLLDRPVKAYTIAFDDAAFDESAAARQLAQHVGAEHHIEIVRLNALDDLLQVVPYLDEPFADPAALPTFHLCRVARQSVTVALNGDGGDEVFGGYQRYSLDKLARWYRLVPAFARNEIIDRFARQIPIKSNVPIEANYVLGLRRLQQVMATPEGASILRWGSYFSEPMKTQLYRPEIIAQLNGQDSVAWLVETFTHSDAGSLLGKTLYTDLRHYLADDGLVKTDRMSMANSLEVRSPFLDYQLVEFMARVPDRYKVRGRQRKILLREAFRADLSPNWEKRPKRGFEVPVSLWLRGSLQEMMQDVLLGQNTHLQQWFRREQLHALLTQHQQGHEDHGRRLWALLILELWLEHVRQKTRV